jgi:hypothetical protein
MPPMAIPHHFTTLLPAMLVLTTPARIFLELVLERAKSPNSRALQSVSLRVYAEAGFSPHWAGLARLFIVIFQFVSI